MVDVVDGVCKGVQVFLLVLLAHVRVVLLLLETHFDGDPAAVQVGLPVQVLYRQQRRLLFLVVHERPELRVLQAQGLDLPQQRKHLVQSLP